MNRMPAHRDSASTRAFGTSDPERQGVFVGVGRLALRVTGTRAATAQAHPGSSRSVVSLRAGRQAQGCASK